MEQRSSHSQNQIYKFRSQCDRLLAINMYRIRDSRFSCVRRSTDLGRYWQKVYLCFPTSGYTKILLHADPVRPMYITPTSVWKYIRDSRTKETMTCAASVLLTSKPVDVIFRPLHAAKRSQEHKPYRAPQSTLPLMYRSLLQLGSLERTKDSERNFQNIYYTGLSFQDLIRSLLIRKVRIAIHIFVHILKIESSNAYPRRGSASRMCLR